MENKKPSNPRMTHPDGMYASEARNEDCYYLRDHFATNVIIGLYSALPERATLDSPAYWVETAYDIAEAMLLEREKRNSK